MTRTTHICMMVTHFFRTWLRAQNLNHKALYIEATTKNPTENFYFLLYEYSNLKKSCSHFYSIFGRFLCTNRRQQLKRYTYVYMHINSAIENQNSNYFNSFSYNNNTTNSNNGNANTQWSVWQQFPWPYIQPEQNRWSKCVLCLAILVYASYNVDVAPIDVELLYDFPFFSILCHTVDDILIS